MNKRGGKRGSILPGKKRDRARFGKKSTGGYEREKEAEKGEKSLRTMPVRVRERKEGRHVDKRGKIENPVQSFDLLRPSDSIEAAQVPTMDRVGSNAESEIIFMTRINLAPPPWDGMGVHLHPPNAAKAQICSRAELPRNFFFSGHARTNKTNCRMELR